MMPQFYHLKPHGIWNQKKISREMKVIRMWLYLYPFFITAHLFHSCLYVTSPFLPSISINLPFHFSRAFCHTLEHSWMYMSYIFVSYHDIFMVKSLCFKGLKWMWRFCLWLKVKFRSVWVDAGRIFEVSIIKM